MKTYKNNSDLAHAWANQLTPDGKGSHFYFEDNIIYSYGRHFPIAYNDNQQRVFFTIDGYSSSTSKHISYTRRACSHIPVTMVKFVPATWNFESEENKGFWIENNIAYWVTQINNSISDYEANPKKTTLLQSISHDLRQLQAFMTAVGIDYHKNADKVLKHPLVGKLDELLEAMRLKRVARKQNEYLSYEERAANKEKKLSKEVEKWRNFKREDFPAVVYRSREYSPYSYTPDTLLRFDSIKNRIETSKGIKVPVQIAAKFWDYILNVLPEGCNGSCNHTIMDYQVKEISMERIVVGCHNIPMSEANKIAELLNWRVLELA